MPIALPVALLASSAIAGGASIASGVIGAHAAGSAADTQYKAGQQAADLARQAGDTANAKIGDVLEQQKALLQPYVNTGVSGLEALNKAVAPGGSLTGQFAFDPTKIADNPNYQFQLSEGMKAVQRAAAAGGTLNSGGTLKALQQYAQGLASNEIGQSYSQDLSTFNTNRNATLQNISLPLQAGQFGTSDLLNALQNYGNLFSSNTLGTAQNVGADITGAANAKAAGTVGAANAYSGALGGLANSAETFALLSALTAPAAGPTGKQLTDSLGKSIQSQYGIGAPQLVTAAPSAFTTAGLPPGLAGYLNTYGAPANYQ